jgi:Na+-driven multidrug efflux pump
MKLWMLVVFLIEGYEIAGQAMTGSLLGSGQLNEARQLGWRLLKLGFLTGLAFAVFFYFLESPLVRLFKPEIRVQELVAGIFPLIIALQPLNGMAFVLDGLLIGAGDTKFLRRAMFISGPPVMLLCARLALNGHGGLYTIWLGLASMMALRLLTNGWRFLSGSWTQTLLGSSH